MTKHFSDNDSECTMESDIYGEGLTPIEHTTIKKLLKLGNIDPKHIIGGKIHPKIAKELYKNNIRVHPKHYIPRDIPKYFHEHELKGGRINLIKSFKKFGSTVKHAFNDIGHKTTDAFNETKDAFKDVGHKTTDAFNATKDFTNRTVNKVSDYANTVLHGRNDYQPKVRNLIKEFGDKRITKIFADRVPVSNVLQGALNVASLGAFSKRMGRQPYDDIFHLSLFLTFDDNSTLKVEKNEVINMDKNPKRKPGSEQHEIHNLPQNLTLNHMLEGARKIQGPKYFLYSANNNNCQDYIMALLRGSNIGTDQDYNFIKQDTTALFKGDSFLRKMSNSVTDLGAKVNEITTGTGLNGPIVQSVIFKKPINKRECVKWLKEHDYKGLEVDSKPEHFRFRQLDPEPLEHEGYHFITKKIDDTVSLIIAYKNKPSNIKYNKMGKSISGCGIESEESIVRKLEKMGRRIEKHQKIHGGKINIANAFKKLGSTIKHGFEDKISKPIESGFKKEIINPVETKLIKPSEKAIVPVVKKTEKYVTSKKGGLASDLLHKGVPMATGYIAGSMAESMLPMAGPVAGYAGNKAGKYAGTKLADYIGSKTGVGLKKRGRPPKNISSKGDLVHIDIGSHDDSPMKGDGLKKRGRKTSLEQYIDNMKAREERELTRDSAMIHKKAADIIRKEKADEHARERREHWERVGGGFKKGSAEAKEHMARIRAMKGSKK